MHHTARSRRATLDRILAITPLPGFDFEQFKARPRADQMLLWQMWSDAERARCAHAAMHAQCGYSDDVSVKHWIEALDRKLS